MWIEWFDYDNHLTWEIKKWLADDWQISQEEAAFMVKIIDKYWRRNIKIRKNELFKLWKEFWLNYSKIARMGPTLERRLRERANIWIDIKNQLTNLKEDNSNNNFISPNWELKNVNRITLKRLINLNIKEINSLIWNKNNFSIINKSGKIYNVFLWKAKNWKTDYYYKDWPNKNKKVKIYDWYKIWKSNSSVEKYRNETNTNFTKRIVKHNNIIESIEKYWINIEDIKSNYEKIQNRKIIGISNNYKNKYKANTEKIFTNYELPNNWEKILKRFNSIKLSDILNDSDFKNLKSKYLIQKYWPEIKTSMMWWVLKSLKNVNHYFKWRIDVTKLPIAINVPVWRKNKWKFENASISFIYNPNTWKINIENFSYWFRFNKVWSNTPDSRAQPLWTHILNLKWANIKNNYSTKIKWSKRWFIFRKEWIDYWINNNSWRRWNLTHWVSNIRANLIKKWVTTNQTITSRWCTIYPDMDFANIMKENRNKKYAIEETTYPIL